MTDRLHRTASTVNMFASVGAAAKRKAVPRSVYPILIETEYGSALAKFVRHADSAFSELRTAMPRILASNSDVRHDASDTDIALRLIDEARTKMGRIIKESDVLAMAKLAGERVSIAQRAELAKQLKAGLGVDVPISDTRVREMLINFSNQNAHLNTTIPTGQLDAVGNLTMRAITKRMTPDTYAEELLKIADVTEGKARQIARNEIGTMNGQLSEERNRELGIDAYYWMTRRDKHVRDTHKAREGVRFLWDRPPVGGHPGIDFGCRCTAKPDLSNVLATIAASQAHGSPGR